MALYVIGDTHLSLGADTDKKMDRFGSRWTDHTEKIAQRWRAVVRDGDTVVLPEVRAVVDDHRTALDGFPPPQLGGAFRAFRSSEKNDVQSVESLCLRLADMECFPRDFLVAVTRRQHTDLAARELSFPQTLDHFRADSSDTNQTNLVLFHRINLSP